MSKSSIHASATHQLPSQATQRKNITDTIPKRIHRVRLFSRTRRLKSAINLSLSNFPEFIENVCCNSLWDQSRSDFIISSIVNMPLRPAIHSAAITAPKAKPSRDLAEWLMVMVSTPDSHVTVCIPGTSPSR